MIERLEKFKRYKEKYDYAREKRENDPFHMCEDDREILHREVVKNEIKRIHGAFHPEAIFLTQTSATPYGWLIKEAWKKAWPEEKIPKFFTIDVKYEVDEYKKRFLSGGGAEGYINTPSFQDRIRKKVDDIKNILNKSNIDINGNIIVFDEAFDPELRKGISEKVHGTEKATSYFAREVIATAKHELMKIPPRQVDDVENVGFNEHRRTQGYTAPFEREGELGEHTLRRKIHSQEEKEKLEQTMQRFKNIGADIGEEIVEEEAYYKI